MVNIYEAILKLEDDHMAGALCTIIDTRGSTPRHEGSKMLVKEDGTIIGTVGGGEVENRIRKEALDSLKDGKIRLLKYKMVDPSAGDPGVCGGTLEVYVEPILPKPLLVVIGGGHVGKAIVTLGKFLDFRVAVSDDRPEYCTPEMSPGADEFYCVPMAQLPEKIRITPHTYLVLTTRGSNIDIEGMAPLLDTPAKYIGVIGSKRRWITTRKALIARGITEARLDQVHSPIGLELNAETPEEIAVSIMAEIIMVQNGGTGAKMKILRSDYVA